MQAFRVRHIDTGLYYTPTRQKKIDGRYKKVNLTKNGKIYTLMKFAQAAVTHATSNYFYDGLGNLIKTSCKSEFKIEEV